MLSFDDYLTQKRIDPNRFRLADLARYQEWAQEFEQMNPASFTAQKKFLLNDIRRKYLVR